MGGNGGLMRGWLQSAIVDAGWKVWFLERVWKVGKGGDGLEVVGGGAPLCRLWGCFWGNFGGEVYFF